MKFQELIFGAITEELKNKKLADALMIKWNDEFKQLNPDVGDITKQEIDRIYDIFARIQGGLRPDLPQVTTFLNHFDGRFGRENFDEKNLKDITKYTYKQIKFLTDEYITDGVEERRDVFGDANLPPTPEILEASKKLWEGQENLLFNEGGLRVYIIPNQITSMAYGYYYHTIYKKALGYNLDKSDREISPWCVTWRPDMGKSNQWGHYRNERTFYFIIDENKDITDRYYMGALQKDNSVSSRFRLTSLKNDGDNAMTWNEIVRIYPQLQGQESLFVSKKFSQEELSLKNKTGSINEINGHENEFRRQPRQIKVQYIQQGGVLSKPTSWSSMDEQLRGLYITQPGLNSNTLMERFGNMNFVREIKKVGNQWTLLNNAIKRFNNGGTSYLVDKLFETEFNNIRVSSDNPNISIYQSKRDGKVGIFDTKKLDWLVMDGKTYDNKYEDLIKQGNGDIYFDETTGEVFIVEPFCAGVRNNSESDDCFYVVYPQDNPKDGHILSNRKFMELQNQLTPEDEMAQNRSSQPKDYADIKEKWGL
jgi:hypothetical protein